jgi:hypothetical protein
MAQQLPLIDTEAPALPAASRPRNAGGTSRPGRRGTPRRATRPRTLAIVPDRPDSELIEVAGPDWRIDEHTKRLGMAGVAAARLALAAAVAHSAA